MVVKFPCNICNRAVADTHKAVKCDICLKWVHIKCNYISNTEYEWLKSSDSYWYCIKCLNDFTPFSKLNKEELKLTLKNLDIHENNSLKLGLSPEKEDLTNSFKILLEQKDFGQPEAKTYNSYCDLDALNYMKISKKSLGILHLNISSLANHIGDLKNFICLSKHKFNIICITESRLQKNSSSTV